MGRVDTGDGIMTPTPLRLVEIAAYTERVQGEGGEAYPKD